MVEHSVAKTNSSEPPIFILGNPRSGTTLLRLMLTCHRNIVVVPENGFSVWLYEAYKDWRWNEPRLDNHFLPDLTNSRKFDTWGVDAAALREFIRSIKPATYRDLASSVYEFYGTSLGKSFHRWGDKNTFYIDFIDTILKIFPDALLIHIVRDVRDVACSYLELGTHDFKDPYSPTLPTDFDEIARTWRKNISIASLATERLGPRKMREIRFEDLVLDTEATLKGVCDFLGEGYDPDMLSYHQQNRLKGLEPPRLLAWKQKTLLPPQPDAVGRYQSEFTAAERKLFTRSCGTLLDRYGYRLA